MISIYIENDEIVVEQYFVTLCFDKEEVESLIMEYYRDEYQHNVRRMVAPEGAYFDTEFSLYNDLEQHDILNDLMMYHSLKPTRIKLIENENK